jgi:3-hydroxyacyl-[acyl-carrier-protein] dehydratase
MTKDNIVQLHPEVENLTLDVEQIQNLIPHRAPILMLEKLKNIVPSESAVGIKCVSVNEPFFQGHFPKLRVMPGVLIVEALAQTAAALVIHSLGRRQEDLLVYFMSIDNARFRKPVVPGDTLELHVKKEQQRGNVWKFTGKAIVNGVVHAEALFTAMIVDNPGS